MEPEPPASVGSADDAASSSSGASTRKKSEATSKKAPLKRQSQDSPRREKNPKRKKPKHRQPPRLNYTVQEGEDMLLIISNTDTFTGFSSTKRKGRGKKLAKGRAKVSKVKNKLVRSKRNPKKTTVEKVEQKESYDGWGQSMPVEVLANIFQMVISQEGAIPFLCRVGRVCHLWNAAAASPALWRSVSVGYCWIAPGQTQLPKTELRIRTTMSWLAQNRFSLLKHFSLSHWKKQVDYVVEVVSQSCPHLQSLKLSYCTGVTTKSFQSLGDNCRSLKSINVQHSELQVEGFVSFLESHGSQIQQILFTHGRKNDRLLAAISRGCCPDLELLEINTNLDSGYSQLPICVQALQNGCPKLQTFRMLNVTPLNKVVRNGPECTAGFPLLEELCIATASWSTMRDQDLKNILYGSPKLRVMDLRGCHGITTAGLAALPCEELECLFWGLYVSNSLSSKKGLHLLTQKWSGTLRELDLTNQLFSEEDLEIAVGHLAQGTGADSLRSLNLSGTKITIPALRLIIGQATALNYLNLSSCRDLPRGLKRVYRGHKDIRQLLDKLP